MATVFATLTPANTLTKLAFDDFVEANIAGLQQDQVDGALASLRVAVEPQRKYDRDAFLLRAHLAQRDAFESDSNAGDTSETVPDPDSEVEAEFREKGLVWHGHFLLGFDPGPFDPAFGWTVGKRQVDNASHNADLLLCTRSFAKQHGIDLRHFHARFTFAADTRGLVTALCSRRPDARLAVDGVQVRGRSHLLNKYKMSISFGKLEYELAYTSFAQGRGFEKLRDAMMETAGAPPHVDVIIPTPSPVTRIIGPWTMGRPLGKGGYGRVFLGTNTNNEMAALKIMALTDRNKSAMKREVEVNRKLTSLAEREDDRGRILRQLEVIHGSDEIVSVHKPVVPMTLADLVRSGSWTQGGIKGMTMEAAAVFRDALLGVKFLHDRGWMHLDLKPSNIGVTGEPRRCVLLDLGSSYLLEDESVEAQPGCGGTVTYLAPERELGPYNHSVDIWAMGIVGYELTYGSHPFKFLINPWRKGQAHEKLRADFHTKYDAAMNRLANDYKQAHGSPTTGYLHLGFLLRKMLRHPWADGNSDSRIDIDNVLSDPGWRDFLDAGEPPESKKPRVDRG